MYALTVTPPLNPAIPLNPPRDWFTPPADMAKDAGCVVEPNGRIYGYLCHWGSVLFDGSNDRWTPPRSRTEYAYAHTGDTVCDDGSTIRTANLGGDAGHAKADLDDPERLQKLQAFYDDTSTQLARVRYGEDANGVWFAGAVWPTVSDLDIARLRASARSGHWAAIGDWKDITSGRAGYELVGACLVNVPGLKYARADRAASGVLCLRPLQMASGADHQGAMVALFLEPDVAGQLAVPDGEAPDTLHVTLAYFEDAAADRSDWDELHAAVAAASDAHLPLAGKIAGQGVFHADDGGTVHWASPDVPGLNLLREDVVARAEGMGFAVRQDHGFTPHITLRYDEPGTDEPAPEVPVTDLAFDRLTLAVGGDMTDLAARSFAVTGSGDLPLLDDREAAWDGAAAEQRIQEWASNDGSGDPDTIDWGKYRSLHFYTDPAAGDTVGASKLPFADIFDGTPKAVWGAITAVAGVLSGAHGGADIPQNEQDEIKSRVAGYYGKARKMFKDKTIVAPWDQGGGAGARVEVAAGGTITFEPAATDATAGAIPVSGILMVEGVPTEDGRLLTPQSVSWRATPLPLYAKLENTPGHDDAILIGRLDTIDRSADDPARILYTGTIFPQQGQEYGQRVLDAIDNETLRGISADGISGPEDAYIDGDGLCVFENYVIAGATLTPMPAIGEASVTIGSDGAAAPTSDGGTSMAAPTDTGDMDTPPPGDGGDAGGQDGADGEKDGGALADAVQAVLDGVAAMSDKLDKVLAAVEKGSMAARLTAVRDQLKD